MKTLLAKARAVPTRRYKSADITKDHIELALAWARDEITYAQAATALGVRTQGAVAYTYLARALRAYIQKKV